MRFIAAILLAATQAATAEERVVCQIEDCRVIDIQIPDIQEEFTTGEVLRVVNDIMSVSGLQQNFQIVSSPEVDNAAAMIVDEDRLLAFNPSWLRQYEGDPDARWILYAVMAHEIGHHLQGHTLIAGGSRPPTELEADEYAGFILAGLGATLDQSLLLWRSFDKRGSDTHPPRDERLTAVTSGYERYVKRFGAGAGIPEQDDETLGDDGAQEPVIEKVGAPGEPPRDPGAPASRPLRGGEICEPLAFSSGPTLSCVSSERGPVDRVRYDLEHLFDGDWDTAWAEGEPGPGSGSVIAAEFEAPVTVAGITFVNGFARSEDDFSFHGRARTLVLTGSNGVRWTVDAIDTPQEQAARTGLFDGVTWIEAEIVEVYPGSRYPDLAITEWRFDVE